MGCAEERFSNERNMQNYKKVELGFIQNKVELTYDEFCINKFCKNLTIIKALSSNSRKV